MTEQPLGGNADPVTRRLISSDAMALADFFGSIDPTYFRPHPLTLDAAAAITDDIGQNVYLATFVGVRVLAYGFLRGWDEGYEIPSLGVAVRAGVAGQGYGRAMIHALHAEALARGAHAVRLRVHPENGRARLLYEATGYRFVALERGEALMVIELG